MVEARGLHRGKTRKGQRGPTGPPTPISTQNFTCFLLHSVGLASRHRLCAETPSLGSILNPSQLLAFGFLPQNIILCLGQEGNKCVGGGSPFKGL